MQDKTEDKNFDISELASEMTNKSQKNIHAEHRQRLKQRMLEKGLDSFAEHEVLELLLFYCIPYKDTNGLAHVLIERYGSLAGVLEASYYDLLGVEGIGEHAALFLSSLPAFFRRYSLNKWDDMPFFRTAQIYGAYATDLFIGLTHEHFYLLCLNTAGRLIKTELLAEGSIDEVSIYVRKALEVVLRHKAKAVILAHNHPSGNLLPSSNDLKMTDNLFTSFANVGIEVYDHVIVGGGKYFSFRENQIALKDTK